MCKWCSPRLAAVIAFAGLGVILLALTGRGSSVEADTPTEEDVVRVEQQLVCPTCSNLRLDFCELAICNDMRRVIREQLASGRSGSDVVEYFVDRYGERILVAPPQSGFHLALWAWPLMAVLAGAAGAVFLLRSWRANRSTPPVEPASLPPPDRVRTELERYRDEGAPWS